MLIAFPDLSKIAIVCASCAAMMIFLCVLCVGLIGSMLALVSVGLFAVSQGAEMLI